MSSFKCLLTASIGKILSIGSSVVEFSCPLDQNFIKLVFIGHLLCIVQDPFLLPERKRDAKNH